MSFAKIERRTEVETMHELLGELDYYKLLQVARDCSGDAVERAFRDQTRQLHPDRFFAAGDAELRDRAHEVYKTINEAWKVLKEPAVRRAYDKRLREGRLRMTTEDVLQVQKEQAKKANLIAAATHPQAAKYWEMALNLWQKKDFKGCALNIQFALTFEPENTTFWKYLEKARARTGDAAT